MKDIRQQKDIKRTSLSSLQDTPKLAEKGALLIKRAAPSLVYTQYASCWARRRGAGVHRSASTLRLGMKRKSTAGIPQASREWLVASQTAGAKAVGIQAGSNT